MYYVHVNPLLPWPGSLPASCLRYHSLAIRIALRCNLQAVSTHRATSTDPSTPLTTGLLSPLVQPSCMSTILCIKEHQGVASSVDAESVSHPTFGLALALDDADCSVGISEHRCKRRLIFQRAAPVPSPSFPQMASAAALADTSTLTARRVPCQRFMIATNRRGAKGGLQISKASFFFRANIS